MKDKENKSSLQFGTPWSHVDGETIRTNLRFWKRPSHPPQYQIETVREPSGEASYALSAIGHRVRASEARSIEELPGDIQEEVRDRLRDLMAMNERFHRELAITKSLFPYDWEVRKRYPVGGMEWQRDLGEGLEVEVSIECLEEGKHLPIKRRHLRAVVGYNSYPLVSVMVENIRGAEEVLETLRTLQARAQERLSLALATIKREWE